MSTILSLLDFISLKQKSDKELNLLDLFPFVTAKSVWHDK